MFTDLVPKYNCNKAREAAYMVEQCQPEAEIRVERPHAAIRTEAVGKCRRLPKQCVGQSPLPQE